MMAPQMPQMPQMPYPMFPVMGVGMCMGMMQQPVQATPEKKKDKDEEDDSSSSSEAEEESKGMTNAKWTGGNSSQPCYNSQQL